MAGFKLQQKKPFFFYKKQSYELEGEEENPRWEQTEGRNKINGWEAMLGVRNSNNTGS